MTERKLDPSMLSLSGRMEFQVYMDFLTACPAMAFEQALLNFQDFLVAKTLVAMRETELNYVKQQLYIAQERNRELMATLSATSRDTRLGEFFEEDSHGE